MASPKPRDPLDALQSLIDDVLIQTGKALRASRKDAQGHPARAPETLQPKLPETIRQWHCALDELEFDILKAKSVLLRDLHQVQERRRLLAHPDPQPADPIPIDLDTPTPPPAKHDPIAAAAAAALDAPKPLMAPFPNMSIDGQPDDAGPKGPGVPAQTAPNPNLKLDPAPGAPDLSGMTFTNMEFSLAPPLSSGGPHAADKPFTPADSRKRPYLPAAAAAGPAPPQEKAPAADKKAAPPDASKFQDLFGNDPGAADGMDFDFSLGGGEETFDDLMRGRDAPLDFHLGPAATAAHASTGTGTASGTGSGTGTVTGVGGGAMSSAEFDAMMMNLDTPPKP